MRLSRYLSTKGASGPKPFFGKGHENGLGLGRAKGQPNNLFTGNLSARISVSGGEHSAERGALLKYPRLLEVPKLKKEESPCVS